MCVVFVPLCMFGLCVFLAKTTVVCNIVLFLNVYACVLSRACFLIGCKHVLLFLFQKISLIV